MTINIVQGDLLRAKEDIIGHQVNCLGIAGSGVAGQIKGKFPEVYSAYYGYCLEHDKSRDLLGNTLFVPTESGKIVANLFGQYDIKTKTDRRQKTRIVKLAEALYRLNAYAILNDKNVALPYKLGSGRGGDSWDDVYNIICEIFTDVELTIYRRL